jgi:hypothetical protein
MLALVTLHVDQHEYDDARSYRANKHYAYDE